MIPFKPIIVLLGEQYIKWSESEVVAIDIIENLQHVVVGQFSYGLLELEELISIIPTQCKSRVIAKQDYSEFDIY